MSDKSVSLAFRVSNVNLSHVIYVIRRCFISHSQKPSFITLCNVREPCQVFTAHGPIAERPELQLISRCSETARCGGGRSTGLYFSALCPDHKLTDGL